ncbi:MAG: ribonuclease HI [Lachnospiraceae bacterium]|nr:ribonuclease HI [Lachnospiraceae bacterium]
MGFRQIFEMDTADYKGEGSVHIYTDGSAIRNGCVDSACGWAYICMMKGQTEYTYTGHDGCVGATNNQMEMTAVLRGLQIAENLGKDKPITVYSDSKYVIETLKGNYTINKNQELWAELIEEVRKFQHIRFEWIKGHANNKYNIEVDRLAVMESKKHDIF